MRKSIATGSLGGSLEEKLPAIAAAGFDAIESCDSALGDFAGSPRDLRRMAADLGLAIDPYHPFRDFEGVDDALFPDNLERAERTFDIMQEVGAPMLLVCSNVSPEAVDEGTRAAAQLHALAERAARRNLLVGYDALAWGTRVKRYRHAWSIVRRAGHAHLGLIIDTFHALSLNDGAHAIANLPGDRIFFLQLSDAPRFCMDVMRLGGYFRCFPGRGHFDVVGFVEQVILTGYRGPASLEVFNDRLRQAASQDVAVEAMESLSLLKQQLQQRLTAISESDAEQSTSVVSLHDGTRQSVVFLSRSYKTSGRARSRVYRTGQARAADLDPLQARSRASRARRSCRDGGAARDSHDRRTAVTRTNHYLRKETIMAFRTLRRLAASIVLGSSLMTGIASAEEPHYAAGLYSSNERYLCRNVLHGELFSRTELFFGRNRPGGVVSEQEFQGFLDQNVTPRFPDGLTVVDAKGQFRGTSSTVPQKEDSKILVLLYRFDRNLSGLIEHIRTEYKQQFEQESVLRVDEQSCVSF